MATHTLKLSNQSIRAKAHLWVDNAPEGMLVKFQDPTRSIDQNAKMWAMLGDISKQIEHNGQKHSPEVWKRLHMHALGHEVQFLSGLNGEVFPAGFRSSELGVKEMSDLIEWMYSWGCQKGIIWSERGFDEQK